MKIDKIPAAFVFLFLTLNVVVPASEISAKATDKELTRERGADAQPSEERQTEIPPMSGANVRNESATDPIDADLSSPPPPMPLSSPSYRLIGETMVWSAMSAAAATGSSDSYRHQVTIGQTSTESSRSESYGLSSGFWEDFSGACCEGRVGDANGTGDYPDEVSLADIMLMVDVLFISNDCTKITCPDEADVNQNGGSNPPQAECLDYLSLGDIMTLVDFLFITGPQSMTLPDCL